MPDNFERLIKLAEETFAFRTDPSQIIVNESVMEQLARIHPASLSEERDSRGPVAWVLVFPTTGELMNAFVEQRISERELLDRTPVGANYSTIYLCSALVLEEHRRNGIAKRLMCEAIRKISKDHPISSLFYWAFTHEGEILSKSVAKKTKLPLFERS